MANLFNKPSSNSTPKTGKRLPSHYPVLSAQTLLKQGKIDTFLRRLKGLAYVTDDYWEQLYQPVIVAFVEFVQGLPAVKYKSFNHYKGWIALGLRRSLETLAMHRVNNPIKNLTPDKVPAKDALLTYALFTAGFFYGLGQIPATYWVMMCNNRGLHGERWNPIAGKMETQGEYYRYSFEKSNRDALANYLTPILAKMLMPESGFTWLSCDKDLFEAWLALLQNDVERGGIIAQMIIPLDLKILQIPVTEQTPLITTDIQETDIISADSLFNSEAEHTKDESKLLDTADVATQFIEWLNKTELNINQPASLAHYTREGLILLYPDLFKEFIKNNPQIKNAQMIVKALQDAGLAQKQLNQYTANPAAKSSGMNLAGITKPQTTQQGQALSLDPTLLNAPIGLPSKNISLNTNTSTINYPAKIIAANTVQPRRGS